MDGHRPPAPKGQAGTESGSQAGSFTFTFSGVGRGNRGCFGCFGLLGFFGAFGAFVSVGTVSSFGAFVFVSSFVSFVSVGSVSSSGFSVSATSFPVAQRAPALCLLADRCRRRLFRLPGGGGGHKSSGQVTPAPTFRGCVDFEGWGRQNTWSFARPSLQTQRNPGCLLRM